MSPRALLRAARSWSGRSLRSLRAALALRRCDTVGRNVRLRGRPTIENHGRLEIGTDVVLQSRPLPIHLGAGPDGSLFIRDRVHVGPGTSLFATGLIVVGEGTRIGAMGLLSDEDRAGPRAHGWRPISRPIVVGRDVVIGSNVTVLPGSFIGEGARIEAGAVVSGIIPPHACAAGAPAVPVLGNRRGGGDLTERVLRVVSEVLDVPGGAELSMQADEMASWDPAGVLRLAHALEEEFDARISDGDFLAVRWVGDLVEVVRRALSAAGGRHALSAESLTEVR